MVPAEDAVGLEEGGERFWVEEGEETLFSKHSVGGVLVVVVDY